MFEYYFDKQPMFFIEGRGFMAYFQVNGFIVFLYNEKLSKCKGNF